MRVPAFHFALGTLLLLAFPAAAVPPPEEAGANRTEHQARPVIGLVLSGGGARGAAHAGILQLLESHRVPVDIVVGTSFGALVGGFYASGMSPEEITGWLEQLDWTEAASDRPPRRALSMRRKQDDTSYALRWRVGYRDGRVILPKGLLSAQGLSFLLREQTLHTARWNQFDDYPIRLRTVATDIERGESVVLSSGPLADALLASMAVPGVVAPVEIDGRMLLDGGLVNNLPVQVARLLGADIIIAVDISTPLAHRVDIQDIFGVSAQVINLVGIENMRASIAALGPDDLLIRPDLSGIGAMDFDLMGEAIQRGLASVPVVAARLRALSLPPHEWKRWLSRQRSVDRSLPVVDFIELDNPTSVPDAPILARMSVRVGEPLSIAALRRDVEAIYSLGEFERIDFEVVERDGLTGLRVMVTPDSLGPNYLRFGLNVEDDLQGGGIYNLLMMHTRMQVNALNGEWRNEFQIGNTRRAATELFQPLSELGNFFVRPRVSWTRTSFDLFNFDQLRVARYDLRTAAVHIDAGYQWRNVGEFTLGLFSEDIVAKPIIGDPGLPRLEDRLAGWQWRLTVDQLDSWTFPSETWFMEVQGRHASRSIGGDQSFSKVQGILLRAWPVTDTDRVVWSVAAAARTGGTLPLYEEFPVGGFLSVSGLQRGALRGAYAFQTRLIWYRSVMRLPQALGDRVYAGFSNEWGNAWDRRADMALSDLVWGISGFVGADLFLGALYLGVGHAEGRRTAGYIFLQRSF